MAKDKRPARRNPLEQLERFYVNTTRTLAVDIENFQDMSGVHVLNAAANLPQVAATIEAYRDANKAAVQVFIQNNLAQSA